jgi:hypothetical protein
MDLKCVDPDAEQLCLAKYMMHKGSLPRIWRRIRSGCQEINRQTGIAKLFDPGVSVIETT